MCSFEKIGEGLSVSTKNTAEGIVRYIKSVEDVINLIKGEAEGKICVVEQAGTTTLGPILSRMSGVVCTTGSSGCHLAIVSREFEIPMIVGCRISEKLEDLDGKKGQIKTLGDGETGELLILKE